MERNKVVVEIHTSETKLWCYRDEVLSSHTKILRRYSNHLVTVLTTTSSWNLYVDNDIRWVWVSEIFFSRHDDCSNNVAIHTVLNNDGYTIFFRVSMSYIRVEHKDYEEQVRQRQTVRYNLNCFNVDSQEYNGDRVHPNQVTVKQVTTFCVSVVRFFLWYLFHFYIIPSSFLLKEDGKSCILFACSFPLILTPSYKGRSFAYILFSTKFISLLNNESSVSWAWTQRSKSPFFFTTFYISWRCCSCVC